MTPLRKSRPAALIHLKSINQPKGDYDRIALGEEFTLALILKSINQPKGDYDILAQAL